MIKIKNGETEFIRDEVSRAYDIDDMRGILDKYSDSYVSWKKFIDGILNLYGNNVSKFASDCGFSRNTVKKWRDNGDMPRSRKEFIKLGFGIRLPLDEINDLLQRYGKYPKLYAKSIEDAIYIYALSHNKSFSEAEELAGKLVEYFEAQTENRDGVCTDGSENTVMLEEQIAELNEDDLENFIEEYKGVFDAVYGKLTEYIDSYIDERTTNYADTKEVFSLNSLLGGKIGNPKVVGYFNDMVSALRTRKVIPNRLRLVALGIHLEMTVDEIDKLLELANMERLCPKDKVECAVIFAIENLLLSDYDDLVGSLLERLEAKPQTKDRCLEIIDKYRRIDEENENAGYGKNEIAIYLADTLQALDIEEARDLLELL
jgi:hypothetical protein